MNAPQNTNQNKKARAVIDGLPADMVALALPLDVQKIVDAGLVRPDWRRAYPNDAIGSDCCCCLFVVMRMRMRMRMMMMMMTASGTSLLHFLMHAPPKTTHTPKN